MRSMAEGTGGPGTRRWNLGKCEELVKKKHIKERREQEVIIHQMFLIYNYARELWFSSNNQRSTPLCMFSQPCQRRLGFFYESGCLTISGDVKDKNTENNLFLF